MPPIPDRGGHGAPAPARQWRNSTDDDPGWLPIDALPDAVIVIGEGGRLVMANRQAESLFGSERGGLVGRSVDDLLPDRSVGADAARRCQSAKEPQLPAMDLDPVLLGRRFDGTEFPVDVTTRTVETAGDMRVVVAVRDIGAQVEARVHHQAETALRLAAERERIARDLHDVVTQRLFAAGLDLQGVAARVADPPLATRIQGVIAQLDATIIDLRSTIFRLEDPHWLGPSLRASLIEVANDAARVLGFEPTVRFGGPLETIDETLRPHVVAAFREMLSNVVRHAAASEVIIEVRLGDRVSLVVDDNGNGPPPADHVGGNGLRNLRARAESLGGSFTLAARTPRGTTATWSIPAAESPGRSR